MTNNRRSRPRSHDVHARVRAQVMTVLNVSEGRTRAGELACRVTVQRPAHSVGIAASGARSHEEGAHALTPTHLDAEAAAATCETPVQVPAILPTLSLPYPPSDCRRTVLPSCCNAVHFLTALRFTVMRIPPHVLQYSFDYADGEASNCIERHLEHALAVGADGTWLDNMGPNVYGAKTASGILLGTYDLRYPTNASPEPCR